MHAIVDSSLRCDVRACARFAGQFALFWSIAQFADWIVRLTAIPVPSAVVGLALMLSLLATGAIRLSWVEHGANFLVRHLTVFFLPITVGLSSFADQFAGIVLGLGAALVVSTLGGIAAAGIVARWITRQPRNGNATPTCRGRPAIFGVDWPDPAVNSVLVNSRDLSKRARALTVPVTPPAN